MNQTRVASHSRVVMQRVVVMTLLILNVMSIKLPIPDSTEREIFHVPYKIINSTTTSILITFRLNTQTFQLALDAQKHYSQLNIKSFVIGQQHSLRSLRHPPKDCLEFKGRDLTSSYSVRMCENVLERGVVVLDTGYLIFRQEKVHKKEIKVEYHTATFNNETTHVIQGLQAPGRQLQHDKLRKRRQLPPNTSIAGTVEFCIFTDHLLYKEYCELYSSCEKGEQELDDYVRTIALGASLYYDRITNKHLKLSLYLKAIYHNAMPPFQKQSIFNHIQLNTLSKYGKPQVDAAKGLQAFGQFQSDFFSRNKINASTYDQVTIITMHGLADEDSDDELTSIGIGYVGGICNDLYKTAICQYKPYSYGWSTIYILAHEIGHNLGATHDGGYRECPKDSNYIMSTHNLKDKVQNLFYFSCCSLSEMAEVIREFGVCLDWIDTTPPLEVSDQMPGVKYGRVVQCEAEFGIGYLPCHDAVYNPAISTLADFYSSFQRYVAARKAVEGVNECLAHWCYKPNEVSCRYSKSNPVLAGTWCDVDKWCIEGQCINQGTLEKGPGSPGCSLDILNLTLRANKAVNNIKEQGDLPIENTSQKSIFNFSTVLGRYTAVIVGVVFFCVGMVGAVCRKQGSHIRQLASRRRQSRLRSPSYQPRAHERRTFDYRYPNSNYNNPERYPPPTIGIPPQYHKVIPEQPVAEHSVRNYQRRVSSIVDQ